MAIALDGFDVLQRIGGHADIFTAARPDVDKAARTIVVKCLKATSLDLQTLRALHDTLHDESFALIVEGLEDAEVKSILSRLDGHRPDVKSGSAAWRRAHLMALAAAGAEPALPSGKKSVAEKPAETQRLSSKVMDLYKKQSGG